MHKGYPYLISLGRRPIKKDRVKKILGATTTGYIRGWLSRANIEDGPVFRRVACSGCAGTECLSLGYIRSLIKQSINALGLKGRYSGHSLRIGSAQSLMEHGASVAELMQEGRWKSPRMVSHYVSGQLAARSATARLRYGEVTQAN